MYCRHCGEENPEEAVYCRNCGELLKEEKAKKAEVIESPTYQKRENNYQNSQTTTKFSTDKFSWMECCLCVIGVFIIFAIIGLL